MAVIIEDRPIKIINDSNGDPVLNSYYNASGGELPTEYDLSNNLYPINTRDTEYSVVGITDQGGRCLVEFLGVDYTAIEADDKFNVNAWVSITANGEVFIGQVVSYEGSPDILLSIPYDTYFASATSIEFNWYAKDYKVLVNVYVGLNPSHPEYANQENEFIAQKNVNAFVFDGTKNLDSFSITGLIKNKITQYYTDITSTELNLNQFTQFRIEYSEVYKLINTSTGQNELYDGTNYESNWELRQPSFTPDDFNCSPSALVNEEFSSDLTGWTNEAVGSSVDWVWSSGSASSTLGTSGSGSASSYLYQDFAYTEGARYEIEAEINSSLDCRFEVWTETNTGFSTRVRSYIIPSAGSTVVNFDFQASSYIDPVSRIKFRAINSDSSGANTVNIEYFNQSQPNEGCLPYLSSVYAVRQFRSLYGGSMGDYEFKGTELGEFLSFAPFITLKPTDINPEISVLANYTSSVDKAIGVKVEVTYSNGETETYYSNSADSGEGVYRVSLNEVKTAIENYIELNNVSVVSGSIQSVGASTNILTNWDQGTFETVDFIGLINPDSIGGASLSSNDTSHPRTGTASGSASNPFSGLGGGGRTGDLIYFESGITYVLSAHVYIGQDDEIASQRWVDDPNQDTFISLAIIDSGGSSLITTDVEYQQISGNIPEYTLITATYTPSTSISAYIGFYKGGTDETVGAQKVYIDDYLVESDEQVITNPISIKYDNQNINCKTYSLKWLNSLGGVDFYTFEGRSTHSIEFEDNERYKQQVFGNWDSNFSGGEGIGFEQFIKYNKTQTVRTKVIRPQLKEYLAGIKTSINVKVYVPEINDYITVLVDKESFIVTEDSKGYYNFQFDITYPDNYVQTA